MINLSSPATSARRFSIEDFLDFGERYGIDYRFPALGASGGRHREKQTVVQGDVEEMVLPSGICLTNSSIEVLQPYDTTSLLSSPLYTLVVLEGRVNIQLNTQEFVVCSGMAFSTRLGEQWVMKASHRIERSLRTLSLGIHPERVEPTRAVSSLLQRWEHIQAPAFVWPVPDYLLMGLQHILYQPMAALPRQLMLEGALLQLLGSVFCRVDALPGCQVKRAVSSSSERCRLENIRQRLRQSPEQPYTLPALAQAAAMSVTSFRNKFRQQYGISVFDYLRECRLSLAHRYLALGYPVQQAAWLSGYQHATNFATAFRRRYGIAPSEVRFSIQG
ncbi:helix-turn-helix transcriptional regulator [Musicola keenii]|uniref:helix-turn-helix transcriptional regulator n=1 Tax=Musicola keenii TaxID=2884250 RepID=UPI001784B6D9|nr:helix-turn-helix domain-containing protein [Musicola keenii]